MRSGPGASARISCLHPPGKPQYNGPTMTTESANGGESQAAGSVPLPRRGFLKIGLIGTVAVAAGGTALALRETVLRETPKDGLKVLSAKEYAIMAAIADVVCPPRSEGVPSASDLDVARNVDRQLAKLDVDVQKEMKTLLGIFDSALTGFLFDGRLRPFTALPKEEQTKAFMAWGDSGVAFRRVAFQALKQLAGAMYYVDQSTWPIIGYNGPPDVSGYREANRLKREAEAAGAAVPVPAAGGSPQ